MSIDAILNQRWRYCHQPIAWRHAIHLVCQPLISEGKVQGNYPLHIIDMLKQKTPKFMINDDVLIVFAQPEENVISNHPEASVIKCNKPVVLQDGNEVTLIIAISAPNIEEMQALHLQIENWLASNQCRERLLQAVDQATFSKRILAEARVC